MARAPSPAQCSTLEQAKESNRVDKMSEKRILLLAGGTYVALPMDQACSDGNLVTAPAWPAYPAWLSAFLTVLGTKLEVRDRVA